MQDLVFILAVLVYKNILTKDEAVIIKKSMAEGVINNNLSQMIDKITASMDTKKSVIDTIDAKSIF